MHTITRASPDLYLTRKRIEELREADESDADVISRASQAALDMTCEAVLYEAKRSVLPKLCLDPPPPDDCQFIYEYEGVKFLVTVHTCKLDKVLEAQATFDV